MNHKGFLDISFAWMFAIIVGAFILFLAIYASYKIISVEQGAIDLKTGKNFAVLLNPLETGFESAVSSTITFPVDTRIHNRCSEFGVFGKQTIQISQKSFNKWTETPGEISFANKYIFSSSNPEGQTFTLFSKPFEMPFKVSDVIYLISENENYCFIDAPEEIQKEIKNLNIANVKTENCSEKTEYMKICFESSSTDCNTIVKMGEGKVRKRGEDMWFEDNAALMYAAIFSSKDVYECELKRLMSKTSQLANIYTDKAVLISRVGCDSNLNADLTRLIVSADSLTASSNLANVNNIAKEIDRKNREASCKLW